MPCGCDKYEAKTVPKKKRRSKRKRRLGGNTGERGVVNIKGRKFVAHKKKGDPRNIAKLKARNPKLYARSQAAKQVAQAMKEAGIPVRITDKKYQQMVSKRAAELLR